jgi:tight adherence protein B
VTPTILSLLTFLAAGTAVVGVYSILSDLYLRDRTRVSRRVDDEFRKRLRDRAQKSLLFKDLRELDMSASGGVEEEPSVRRTFESMVEQSGLDLTPNRLLAIVLASGLTLGVLGGLIRRDVLVAVVGAVVGTVGPLWYVKIARDRRQEKILSQLPDSFDLMSRVIRAGQTMAQAIQAVADEFAPPIAGEFAFCFEQQNLGLPPETALRELARRTGLLELKIFVLALLVQQQTGGNLAEMLDNLSIIIRERYRMRGKIQALTAEGRFQAIILLALPPGLFVMMLGLNSEYGEILLKHPPLIWMTLISEAIGALWIRKIIHFDY